MSSSFRWLGILVCVSGCAAFEPGGALSPVPPKVDEQQAAVQRQRFLMDRDPAALNWLLRSQVQNGQSVAEVADILGESGERHYDDRAMKVNGGHYLSTDVGYRWGPDARGRSVVLFFRDGKLVNFDPNEFARQ